MLWTVQINRLDNTKICNKNDKVGEMFPHVSSSQSNHKHNFLFEILSYW